MTNRLPREQHPKPCVPGYIEPEERERRVLEMAARYEAVRILRQTKRTKYQKQDAVYA